MAKESGLPLLVHLHGNAENGVTPQWLYVRAVCQLVALLSFSHCIHVHCFTGETNALKMWVEAFPHILFQFHHQDRDPSGGGCHLGGDWPGKEAAEV